MRRARGLVRHSLIFAAALVLLAPGRAAAAEQEVGIWTEWTLDGDSREGTVSPYFNFQTRSALDPPDYEQIVVRPAVHLNLTDEYSIWLGGDFDPTFVPQYRYELLIWEQFQAVNKFEDGRIDLTNRTRLEDRWVSYSPSGVPVFRLRHLLRLQVAIDDTASFVVSEEPFVNLNSAIRGPQAGFSENRAFLGLDFKLTDEVRLEFGYLDRYVSKNEPKLANTWQHYVYFGMSFQF